MTAHNLEREVLSGLTTEQRAPAPALGGVATPNSEYAQTVVADGEKLEKTGSLSSRGQADHDHDVDALSGKGKLEGGDAVGAQAQADADAGILTGAKLYLVFLALMLAVFVSTNASIWRRRSVLTCSDVCARPIDRRDSHPSHCLGLSVVHYGRLDVSLVSHCFIHGHTDDRSITAYFREFVEPT